MFIALGALAMSTVLAIGTRTFDGQKACLSLRNYAVIRQMLVAKNRKLDVDEGVAMATINSVRVKDAAVLEGISYEEALERRKEVRYLY